MFNIKLNLVLDEKVYNFEEVLNKNMNNIAKVNITIRIF